MRRKLRLRIMGFLPDEIPLRLLKGLTIGSLWIYVLAVLAIKPSYPYDVRRLIKELFGFEPPIVTLYMTFYRLERDGFIIKSQGVYRVSRKGLLLLNEAVTYLKRLAARIEEASGLAAKLGSEAGESDKEGREKENGLKRS